MIVPRPSAAGLSCVIIVVVAPCMQVGRAIRSLHKPPLEAAATARAAPFTLRDGHGHTIVLTKSLLGRCPPMVCQSVISCVHCCCMIIGAPRHHRLLLLLLLLLMLMLLLSRAGTWCAAPAGSAHSNYA